MHQAIDRETADENAHQTASTRISVNFAIEANRKLG